MAIYELTEDEAEWVGIAIEGSLASAKRLADSDDVGDQLDAGLLVSKFTPLAEKFPAPEIRLREPE
jgi:hypothetical protein